MAGDQILVVDDNPQNLKLTHVILAGEGYDVKTAIDAEQALRILKSFRPRLILMDLQHNIEGPQFGPQQRNHWTATLLEPHRPASDQAVDLGHHICARRRGEVPVSRPGGVSPNSFLAVLSLSVPPVRCHSESMAITIVSKPER
jgi:CheY-like chemotaxis protein